MEPMLPLDEDNLRQLLTLESFAELYNRLDPHVRRWCSTFGLPPAEVDDVVQGVWDHLHSLIRKYDRLPFDPSRASSFLGWIYRVARNVATDHQRRRSNRLLPVADASAVENVPAPSQQDGLSALVEDDFWAAVASRLDPRSRELLRLYREGETCPGRLQALLGVSQPTLWRTRDKVRQVVEALLPSIENK